MNFKLHVSSVILLLISCIASHAECDPAKFLKYEDVKFSQDIALQSSFLEKLNTSDSAQIDKSGGFKYGGVSLNGESVRRLASTLQKQLQIDFSYEQRLWYTFSKLSETGKDAYFKCLENEHNNFRLSIVGDATNSELFIVDVKSTPVKDQPRVQQIKVNVINGSKTGGDEDITLAGQAELNIKRDLDKPVTISVRIGDEIHRIFLPSRPRSVAIEYRSSEGAYKDAYGGENSPQQAICYNLPNDEQDAAIIPDTMAFQKNAIEEKRGSIRVIKTEQSSRAACSTVQWYLDHSEGRVRGTAYITVLVAKVLRPDQKRD